MHGEIFNAEMAPAFPNSTDVTEKVIVTTEWMSTSVVSYIITNYVIRNLNTIEFGVLHYILFSKNV